MKRRKFLTRVGVTTTGALFINTGAGITCKSGGQVMSSQSIPFDFPDLQPPEFKKQIFDIREYGAKSGKDAVLNTETINHAIIDCSQAGGGRVLVPSGVWMTGPVHLKSNVNLHLGDGAELRFSKKFDNYLPVVLIRRGGILCYNYSPPLYARNCENIAVTGSGILDGQGLAW